MDGEREELYWNKVPEKVRREAVWKAIAQANGAHGGEDGADEQQQQEGKRPRKRRRKA